LSVPAGANGIEVISQNVTIDLNGFVISGAAGSFHGMSLGNNTFCRVHNGTIFAMGISGIVAQNTGALIENVRVRSCGSTGIDVSEGTVRQCEADFNQGTGILAQVIEGCKARANQGGLLVSGGASGRATGNHVQDNGIVGIICSGGLVEGNVVTGTVGTGAGIQVNGAANASCAIIGNAIIGNAGAGIRFNGADATKTGIANNVIQGNGSAYSGGTPTSMGGNVVQP
ncbi:MAG: right-handed parallel beta-helix repeat-containing protein, partial [Actinobacteria bacterium]|nr:right-handed parallel beta-helix repeat-containing protein [Actinomycetota bacterium]